MAVAILRYNAGNVRSVAFALQRLGVESLLTDDPAALRAASHVIFPGVGEASSAMAYLRERGLDEVIRSLTQPVLGICLGLQLLCESSTENDTGCLGIFPHRVLKFEPGPARLKVPLIGWNTVTHSVPDARADAPAAGHASLFGGISQQAHFYFVHSYYADLGPDTCARTDYGCTFSSALARDNFRAVQFHPEKSADNGARLLENFLESDGNSIRAM